MSVKMKFGSKDIPFVYKGDKLIYPNPIKDGLLLWYDFKGMRNTDTNKEVANDLSGNGNDGTLQNFNFSELSGYSKNSLLFDGIDDKLQIPDLGLNPASMSVELNGKTYSYDGDKVVSVDEDGNTVVGEINMLSHSNFSSWGDWKVQVQPAEIRDGKLAMGGGERTAIAYQLSRLPASKSGSPEFYSLYVLIKGTGVISAAEGAYSAGRGTRSIPSNSEFTWLEIPLKAGMGNSNFTIEATSQSFFQIDEILLVKGEPSDVFYSPQPSDFTTTEPSFTNLSSLQLYNKPLNKTELLHNVGKQSPKELKEGQYVQDGLVLHYDFSHESNNSEYKDKAFDYSGNGNHGVLTNFAYSDYSGYQNGGLEFDGVDDEVVIPYKNNIFSVDFTWSAVIKPYIVDKDMMFMYGSTTAQYFRMQNGKLGASVRGQDSPVAYTLTSFALEANTAYHVVLSHTNGDFKIYANGKQVGESDRGMKNERYRLSWIGKYTSSDPRAFEGAILSAQVHNKALSAEEIAHNYQIEKEKFNIE